VERYILSKIQRRSAYGAPPDGLHTKNVTLIRIEAELPEIVVDLNIRKVAPREGSPWAISLKGTANSESGRREHNQVIDGTVVTIIGDYVTDFRMMAELSEVEVIPIQRCPAQQVQGTRYSCSVYIVI